MTKVMVKGGKTYRTGRPTRAQLREEGKVPKELRVDGNGRVTFDEFKTHVARLALGKKAPASVLSVYKELLRLEHTMSQGSKLRLSADEVARRNLIAERELREGGYA